MPCYPQKVYHYSSHIQTFKPYLTTSFLPLSWTASPAWIVLGSGRPSEVTLLQRTALQRKWSNNNCHVPATGFDWKKWLLLTFPSLVEYADCHTKAKWERLVERQNNVTFWKPNRSTFRLPQALLLTYLWEVGATTLFGVQRIQIAKQSHQPPFHS